MPFSVMQLRVMNDHIHNQGASIEGRWQFFMSSLST